MADGVWKGYWELKAPLAKQDFYLSSHSMRIFFDANMEKNDEQAGAELCQAQHSLS